MHSNVTIKNVSWPHFTWPTLYTCLSISLSVSVFTFQCNHTDQWRTKGG